MAKLKQYWLIILIVLIVIGGAVYWFQWRPNQIRKECYRSSDWAMRAGSRQTFDDHYEQCLTSKGLEK